MSPWTGENMGIFFIRKILPPASGTALVFLGIGLVLVLGHPPAHGETKNPARGEVSRPGESPLDDFGCLDCHTAEGIFGRVSPASRYTHRRIRINPYTSTPVTPMRPTEEEAREITSTLTGLRADVVSSYKKNAERISASRGDEETIRKGREIYGRLGCQNCHRIGEEGFEKGPDLSAVGSRLKPGWIYTWMKNPQLFFPNTPMPYFPLPEEDLFCLVAYLDSLRKESPPLPYDDKQGNSDLVDEGKELFGSVGCVRCHLLDGRGGIFAPDLSYEGDKVRKEWLYQFLKTPYPIRPEGPVVGSTIEKREDVIMIRMPVLFLDPDQLRTLVEYIATLTFDRERPGPKRGARGGNPK